MKKTEIEALRALPVEELEAQVVAARAELFKGRFSQATGGEALGVQGRNLRRQVARLQTIIGQKKSEAV